MVELVYALVIVVYVENVGNNVIITAGVNDGTGAVEFLGFVIDYS